MEGREVLNSKLKIGHHCSLRPIVPISSFAGCIAKQNPTSPCSIKIVEFYADATLNLFHIAAKIQKCRPFQQD